MLFGATVIVPPFLFAMVNPFFEELLVRAFLITEVQEKFGSIKVAAISSIVLQSSYHLYQGFANALTVGVIFTIFTVFYVATRRILPTILATWISTSSQSHPTRSPCTTDNWKTGV